METNQFDDMTAGSTSNECTKNGSDCDCRIRHPIAGITTQSDLPTKTHSEPAGAECLETKGSAGIDCEELDDSGDFLDAIFMAEEG